VIAFGVLDTAMTARYSADDLAALAMASAIFISYLCRSNRRCLSACADSWSSYFGAKRHQEIGEEVRQATYWLAIGSTVIGCLILLNADQLLSDLAG
jgi:MATE family multidrug resistance protein